MVKVYEELIYEKDKFKNMRTTEMFDHICDMGFNPILINNSSGFVYNEHKHPETKLLVFVEGTMEVKAKGNQYSCSSGDLLVIPGGVMHSAVVGTKGCKFYWSEKVF